MKSPAIHTLSPMFPLSCVHVRTHTGHEMSAHKNTWSTHKFSLKNVFAHISYMVF